MSDTIAEPVGLDEFLDAYVTAALWSSNDESDDFGGEPLDGTMTRATSPPSAAKMRSDCQRSSPTSSAVG